MMVYNKYYCLLMIRSRRNQLWVSNKNQLSYFRPIYNLKNALEYIFNFEQSFKVTVKRFKIMMNRCNTTTYKEE